MKGSILLAQTESQPLPPHAENYFIDVVFSIAGLILCVAFILFVWKRSVSAKAEKDDEF